MHQSVAPLAGIFRLNTELLLNCLEDLDEAQAGFRGTQAVNSIAFLVAHLAESRHFAAGLLGAPLPSPFPEAFSRARTLDDAGPLPRLAALQSSWERISAHLAVVVERADTTQLAQPSQQLPGSDGTLLGALAFLAQHESYHLGQIALLRRQQGLPAMHYGLRPREPGRRGA
jgi:uncharacterized damage-inducible protein DinB